MLHPFMPFVTEDLYQRLPRRPNDKVPSIMKAEYPKEVAAWDNEQACLDFEFVNRIVHASRSLLSDYSIRANAVCKSIENNFVVYVQSPEKTALLKAQSKTITALVRGAKELNVLEATDAAPEGCSLYAFDQTKLFLVVRGMVNIDDEIQKLEKKRSKLTELSQAIIARQSAESYAINVKEEVKANDNNKLNGYQAEIAAIAVAMENFLKLK